MLQVQYQRRPRADNEKTIRAISIYEEQYNPGLGGRKTRESNLQTKVHERKPVPPVMHIIALLAQRLDCLVQCIRRLKFSSGINLRHHLAIEHLFSKETKAIYNYRPRG